MKCLNCNNKATWYDPNDNGWCHTCVPRNCKWCNSIRENDAGEVLETLPREQWKPCIEIWNHGEDYK